MFETFLFIALPYIALTSLIVGSIWRYHSQRYSYSALSSQLVESRQLLFGSIPWHIGIIVVFIGHLMPFLFPQLWETLTSYPPFLYCVETIGIGAAVLAVVGLAVLLVRRVLTARLQHITTVVDLVVLGLLLVQVAMGLAVATTQHWGARWSAGTLAPYLWGILTFHPNIDWVSGMPAVVQVHLVGAWLIFLLVPFSRLVHIFSLPIQYVVRAPQRIVWATQQRLESAAPGLAQQAEGRRHFVKAVGALVAAGGLLAAGVLDKLGFFLRGPSLTAPQQSAILEARLGRLSSTVHQRELRLERMRDPFILVARLADLKPKIGKYFTDYNMRPALAFLDPTTGLPRLLSAKCTHLGCTVSNRVNAQGRILCPCHLSLFNVTTGVPTPSSPAKSPLPLLGFVVRDASGKELVRRPPHGPVRGTASAAELVDASVYIVRAYASQEI